MHNRVNDIKVVTNLPIRTHCDAFHLKLATLDISGNVLLAGTLDTQLGSLTNLRECDDFGSWYLLAGRYLTVTLFLLWQSIWMLEGII